ncbi:hypothetical protein ACLB2K_020067 [Fragaria x ananassa]
MGKNVEEEVSCKNVEKQRDKELIDLTNTCKNVEKEAPCKNVEKQKDEEIIDLTNPCKNVEKPKMFIPIHDEDHWYLFVVRIDNETGEYWDSYGDKKSRKDHCKEILKIFDIIFGHLMKKTKKFEDFPIFKPPQCP